MGEKREPRQGTLTVVGIGIAILTLHFSAIFNQKNAEGTNQTAASVASMVNVEHVQRLNGHPM